MQKVLARRLKGLVPESQTGIERLIDKKRASYDLQVELDRKKQEHAVKMAQFKVKADELEQKNLENQQEVLSKDKFVRDNWNKRQREEERLNQEIKALESKQKDLNDLLEEQEKLKQREDEIKTQLAAALPYKHYLDSVFEAAPEMISGASLNEVQGIVNKYQTLKEWRGTLQVRLLRSKKELIRLRDAISIYDESSTNSSVEIDYQIKCIAQAQEASFKEFGRERHMQETMATAQRQKAQEAAVVRLTIENMYQKALEAQKNLLERRISRETKDQPSMTLLEKFQKTKDLISDMIYIEENIKERQANPQGTQSYRKGLLAGLK